LARHQLSHQVGLVAAHTATEATPAILELRLVWHGVKRWRGVIVEWAAPIRLAIGPPAARRRSHQPLTDVLQEGGHCPPPFPDGLDGADGLDGFSEGGGRYRAQASLNRPL